MYWHWGDAANIVAKLLPIAYLAAARNEGGKTPTWAFRRQPSCRQRAWRLYRYSCHRARIAGRPAIEPVFQATFCCESRSAIPFESQGKIAIGPWPGESTVALVRVRSTASGRRRAGHFASIRRRSCARQWSQRFSSVRRVQPPTALEQSGAVSFQESQLPASIVTTACFHAAVAVRFRSAYFDEESPFRREPRDGRCCLQACPLGLRSDQASREISC